MLYLLQTLGPVKWADMPARPIIEAARTRADVDLMQLGWRDAERVASIDDLRAALRHGVPCAVGIVIDAGLLVQLDQADNLRRISRGAEAARADLEPQLAAIDRMMPGSAKYRAELNEGVAQATQDAIEEFEAEAAEVLSAPVRADLVEHWVRLGGRTPDPA